MTNKQLNKQIRNQLKKDCVVFGKAIDSIGRRFRGQGMVNCIYRSAFQDGYLAGQRDMLKHGYVKK